MPESARPASAMGRRETPLCARMSTPHRPKSQRPARALRPPEFADGAGSSLTEYSARMPNRR
eukprot:scaffold2232_cov365-Prasinococcus_capsulatus_cf.AAC.2